MKNLILSLALVASAACFGGTGATTNWVAQYVAQYVSNAISNSTATMNATATTSYTNGTLQTTIVSDGMPITVNYQRTTVAALIATNCYATATSQGVTNGTLWAWNGATTNYLNKTLAAMIPTKTNMVWKTYQSHEDDGTWFYSSGTNKMFEIRFTAVTPNKAREVKGE